MAVTDGAGGAADLAEAPSLVELKRRDREAWAAGDFSRIAELTLAVGTDLVDRLGIREGMDVLDVATGTGNAAIPAAAAGARVTGLDLAPELLEVARARAANRGLRVEWVAGDAEELPFEDGRFDRVLSTFGVQFAPRHGAAARELARVCAPGGMIGLANWTPQAPPSRVIGLVGSSLADRERASPPHAWGVEEHVRELFAGTSVELAFDRATIDFEYEGSVEAFVAFYETHFGPLAAARERLSSEAWGALGDRLTELWRAAAETRADGRFRAPAEYLVVLGRKPGAPRRRGETSA